MRRSYGCIQSMNSRDKFGRGSGLDNGSVINSSMTETDVNAGAPEPPTRSQRRGLRFSLRTLLIAITLFCVWLGVSFNRANRQRRVVEAIKAFGGDVRYDYATDDDGSDIPNAPPPPW